MIESETPPRHVGPCERDCLWRPAGIARNADVGSRAARNLRTEGNIDRAGCACRQCRVAGKIRHCGRRGICPCQRYAAQTDRPGTSIGQSNSLRRALGANVLIAE